MFTSTKLVQSLITTSYVRQAADNFSHRPADIVRFRSYEGFSHRSWRSDADTPSGWVGVFPACPLNRRLLMSLATLPLNDESDVWRAISSEEKRQSDLSLAELESAHPESAFSCCHSASKHKRVSKPEGWGLSSGSDYQTAGSSLPPVHFTGRLREISVEKLREASSETLVEEQ